MLVRPYAQNVPGKIGEVSPSGYTLHPRETGPEVVQGPGGVTFPASLGVEPAELSWIAIDRELFRVFLGLLSPQLSPRKTAHENE